MTTNVRLGGSREGVLPAGDNWRLDAKCRHLPTDFFFPPKGANRQSDRAREVCRNCPVRIECLNEALEMDAEGIWGGTTNDERRRLRRKQRRGTNVKQQAAVRERQAKVREMAVAGVPSNLIAEALGCSRDTVYRDRAFLGVQQERTA